MFILIQSELTAQNYQPTPNDTLTSVTVNSDKSVTLSIYAPSAEEIKIGGTDIPENLRSAKMLKHKNSVWETIVGPLEPGPALVGGLVEGPGWRYFLSVAEPRFRLSFEPELELLLRNHLEPGGGRSIEDLTRVRLEADVESGCYYTTYVRTYQFGSEAPPLEVRFRVEYRPAQPRLYWDKGSYSVLGTDRFRLLLLPMPQLGVVRVEVCSDFRNWQRHAVLPTWFEHSESAPVFGPTWRLWYGDASGRAPQRFFRITQALVTPTTNAIVDFDIRVAGFSAEGEVLSFGAEVEEVLVRARWTGLGETFGTVQLGVTDGSTSAWVTQEAFSEPQEFAEVIRLPAGGMHWTLFVRYAEEPRAVRGRSASAGQLPQL